MVIPDLVIQIQLSRVCAPSPGTIGSIAYSDAPINYVDFALVRGLSTRALGEVMSPL